MRITSSLPSTKSTVSTKSIKPRPNPAQSCLIVPNRAIFPCFDMTTDPKTAKFRNWQLPGSVLSDRSVRSGNPQLAAPVRSEGGSKPVKPGQTPSKCFPFVIVGPPFQPPSPYIVVSPAKCTTRCGLPLQHTPTQPCNPQFESNPVKVSQSVFQTPLSGLGFCTPLLPPDPQLGKHHPSCPIQSYPTDSGNPPCPPKLQRRRKSAIRVKPSRTQSHL
jgi:hypothetical protein